MESESKTTQKVGDTETTTIQKSLSVNDGKFVWTLNETAGTKMVTKTKPPADDLPWAALKHDNEFKVLPDEKIDGADCFVIETTRRSKEAGDQSRSIWTGARG